MIGGCLDALVNQNYPKEDYEIIVVNDGSTDNTLKVIKDKQNSAAAKNVEIKAINLEPNQGWIIARETGAKNAKYNLIASAPNFWKYSSGFTTFPFDFDILAPSLVIKPWARKVRKGSLKSR